jgi:chitin synthase
LEEAITTEIVKETIMMALVGRKLKTSRTLHQFEVAHIFEAKTNFGLGDDYPELNLLFVVKQKNKRKLNSHFWFFGGFCKMIVPKYVLLLDVGTEPMPDAVYLLWKAMNIDQNCVGVAGEIVPSNYSFWNFIVAA